MHYIRSLGMLEHLGLLPKLTLLQMLKHKTGK